jgi:type I restriction enzyme R subunit
VYRKYRAIFEYFDALLVGLTATPRDEIDHDTYGLFDLESGVPTVSYDLEDAVGDGYLVPMRAVSVPLKFQREGIRYADLSDEERERWDATEWSEDGEVPELVEAAALNRWLFNADPVDKVLEHLMTHGQTVAGGDRLGKTIIVATKHAHAEFIATRFDANYPRERGHFARVIDFQIEYAQHLIDEFMVPSRAPHIAISVDMLDTGIDVPEVVNLVFVKLVRSKTKFWEMLGRGTRLCADLFGPGRDKEYFSVFDFCQNLEFVSQNPPTVGGGGGESLGARLFASRLELIGALDERAEAGMAVDPPVVEAPASYAGPRDERQLRDETAALLHGLVAAMNVENFVVRPHRRLVEQYAQPGPWARLDAAARGELARSLGALPAEVPAEDEEAKRFDLLVLRLQLALLRAEPGFARLRDAVRAIAGLLEEKATIAAVRQELRLIEELQRDEWWQDVSAPMLEQGSRPRTATSASAPRRASSCARTSRTSPSTRCAPTRR